MNKYIVGLGAVATALIIGGAGCASSAPQTTEAPKVNEEAVETTASAPDTNAVVAPEAKAEVKVETSVEPVTTDKSAVNPAAPASTDAVTFNVSGVNFAFDPKEMKVKKGQKVTVNFTSDMGFHDFVIDELNVRTPQLKSPGTASVTFTADKVGTFEYYCSVGQHRLNGMVGKLIVE